MGDLLEKFAVKALDQFGLDDEVNAALINRLVNAARHRPHPWSTRYPYICWSGLTDRTYNSRLLPPKPYPPAEALGTRRPPLAEVAKLFAAKPTGQRVCAKSTCLFPAFAQYLTDGFIRTQISNDEAATDRRRTTSNHEIDLSPLYGRTEAQTDVLRLKSESPGSKGLLKTQLIGGQAFPRFLFDASGNVAAEFHDQSGRPALDLPLGLKHAGPNKATLFAVGGDRVNATPQVSMINTLLLREHNRLAGMLEAANPTWDDERVFQIARNILIVMFIKLVVEEYINHINTSAFRFRADPEVAWKADWNRPNWMTAEFSLLYRWHSLVPETLNWNGRTVNGAALLLNNRPLIEGGLADAFVAVSANAATELGLGNSASFLVPHEASAVAQARTNELAGYNDYRRAMDMDPAKSFAELVGKSKDAAEQARRDEVARQLKALYGSVDNVEFYVGLFAEPRPKNGPLPDLLLAMVAMDAFSQALTNPLLSRHVWGDKANRQLAFTDLGLAAIESTNGLRDIVARNTPDLGGRFVGMTRPGWKLR
jgi:prostaglandin-endoperoxide synthase 2